MRKELFFDRCGDERVSSKFFFKGLPTLEDRNRWQIGQTRLLETRVAESDIRIRALTRQLTEVGHEVRVQRRRSEEAEAVRASMKVIEERATVLSHSLESIVRSRSWRYTMPLRAVARYIRHGHFDSHGQVGMYEVAQWVGRRLPVHPRVRAKIGQLLSRSRGIRRR